MMRIGAGFRRFAHNTDHRIFIFKITRFYDFVRANF